MNKEINGDNTITWSRTGTNTDCSSGTNRKLLDCQPILVHHSGDSNANIRKYAEVIDGSFDLVEIANNDPGAPSTTVHSLLTLLTEIKDLYIDYLEQYRDVLQFLKDSSGGLMNPLRSYITPGKSFSFINGHFILTNLKILLKYLKYSLGKDFYTVGVCLIVVGCSLILSVSSTILLIVIINIGLKEDMNMKNNAMTQSPGMEVSHYQINNPNTNALPKY